MAGFGATAANAVKVGSSVAGTAATGLDAASTMTQMNILAAENRAVQMTSATIDAGNTFTKALKDHIKKGSEAATTQG
jgi:hypothetical protein